jgi:hypothetical protein
MPQVGIFREATNLYTDVFSIFWMAYTDFAVQLWWGHPYYTASPPTVDDPIVADQDKSNDEIRIRPITRARAKLLQQQVNSLLAESDIYCNENFILPKSLFICDEDIPTTQPSPPTVDDPIVADQDKSNDEIRIGPITRARAKLLQQQVNSLLAESDILIS